MYIQNMQLSDMHAQKSQISRIIHQPAQKQNRNGQNWIESTNPGRVE